MPLTSRFSRGEVNLANWKNNGKLIDSIISLVLPKENRERIERAEIISGSNSRLIQGQFYSACEWIRFRSGQSSDYLAEQLGLPQI